MVTGNIAEINRYAGRVGVRLNGGQYAVCRLLEQCREMRPGESVQGLLTRPGAGLLIHSPSGSQSRVLVLAIYNSAEPVREMVYC